MLNHILNFIEGRYIYCPRCLERWPIRGEVDEDMACKQCRFLIPMTYIEACHEAPPVFVQLFGLPACGKTTFLDMLRRILYDMDNMWGASGYYTRPLTQLDMDHKTILLTQRDQGILAPSTPKRTRDQNDVHIIALKDMPRWGSRTLVLMDHSGEQFEKLHYELEDIPFLQHTQIAILLISLPDLASAGKQVDDLINSYIQTLEDNKVNLARERRQLIIVFSKADLLAANLPPALSGYLSSDTTYVSLKKQQVHFQMSDEQMENYLQKMDRASDLIREWVETLPGGISMLHMLADRGVTTHFTMVSATGHPLTPGGSTLAPHPRRVLDPFFWVLEYYKRLGSRGAVRATLRTLLETFSPTLRATGSLALLVLLFIGTLLGSLYLSRLSQGSPDLVNLGLALVALFLSALASQWVKRPVPSSPPASQGSQGGAMSAGKAQGEQRPVVRSVLNATRLALFLACVAIFTLPTVQYGLSQVTLRHLLEALILGAALFSCFQPAARQAALSRVTLAAIAGTGAFLQYTYGSPQELRELYLSFPGPDGYMALSYTVVWTLLALAAIAPLISPQKRNGWDRFLLLIVTGVYAALQFVYGPRELQQAFPPASHPFLTLENVAIVNDILVGLVLLASLFSLFAGYRFARLDRLSLLILAVVTTGLLNYLGDGMMLPGGVTLPIGPANAHLLTNQAVSLLAPNRIVAYGLIAMGVLMLFRWLFPRFPKTFGFLDHAALFFVAIVCAQLQTFPWGDPASQGFASGWQGYLLVANRIVAKCLIVLVYLGGGLGLLLLLLPLVHQIKQVKRLTRRINERFTQLTRLPWFKRGMARASQAIVQFKQAVAWPDPEIVKLRRGMVWLRPVMAWLQKARAWLRRTFPVLEVVMRVLERVIVCATAVGCALLVELYGQVEPVSFWTFHIGGIVTTYQLVASFFVILAIIAICLMKFSLQRGDRFLLLMNIILCTAFYLGKAAPPLPLSFVLQNWNEAAYHSQVPHLFFASLCLGTALISFWWAEHSRFSGDRRLLQIIFGLALAGGFLQLITSTLFFILLALFALITGMAVATIANVSYQVP